MAIAVILGSGRRQAQRWIRATGPDVEERFWTRSLSWFTSQSPSSSQLASRRQAPPDESIVQLSSDAHLDDERSVLLPEPQHALAAGAADTVGGELVGSQCQVRGSVAESCGDGVLGGEAAHRRQSAALNSTTTAPAGGWGRGSFEGRGDLAVLAASAGMALAGPIDEGMAEVGIVDHDPLER